jgi:hypothetical protein
MKMKTMRRIDEQRRPEYQEFASIENGMMYTHQHPYPLGEGATIEYMKSICTDCDIEWDKYEIVEIEYFDAETVGADIRNKLGPFKNLIAMVRDYENVLEHISVETRDRLMKKQLTSCDSSLDYLSKLM